jgi:hypothetical protein
VFDGLESIKTLPEADAPVHGDAAQTQEENA